MLDILFASSEVYPLIKTGGLADVSGALPIALSTLSHNVTILMPAYKEVLSKTDVIKSISQIYLPGIPGQTRLWETTLPNSKVRVILVDYPAAFGRSGNPYTNPKGDPWDDNAERFYLFCQVITRVALNQAGLGWQPDIVHCNDWQTGLVPALLSQYPNPPATLFTIHNLAYQGLFPYDTAVKLGLANDFWQPYGLEFYNQLSFIKGGLVYADRVNTVSPNYMQEIQTPQFGCGLDGLMQYRDDDCSGIVNGIDIDTWNPATDSNLIKPYDQSNVAHNKAANKIALQTQFSLKTDNNTLLLGFIGRLVEQKGIDIIAKFIEQHFSPHLQLVILGSGDPKIEQTLVKLAEKYPQQIAVTIGYNESLAHQIEAGIDVFLMPSRFEPCGLNQLYSLRYGTLPLVHGVGGLIDTVVNADKANIKNGSATGFIMTTLSSSSLKSSVDDAYKLFQNKKVWNKLISNAMNKDVSWKKSADEYVSLYNAAIKSRHPSSQKETSRH